MGYVELEMWNIKLEMTDDAEIVQVMGVILFCGPLAELKP